MKTIVFIPVFFSAFQPGKCKIVLTTLPLFFILICFNACSSKKIQQSSTLERADREQRPVRITIPFNDLIKINLPYGAPAIAGFDSLHIWDNEQMHYTDEGKPVNELAIAFKESKSLAYSITQMSDGLSNFKLSEEFVGQLKEEIAEHVFDLNQVVISDEVYAYSYAVINADTLVFFRDNGKYDYSEVDEGEFKSYVNYSCAAFVKNDQVTDCVLLSYYEFLMYETPFRSFYIDEHGIQVRDFRSMELETEANGLIRYQLDGERFSQE